MSADLSLMALVSNASFLVQLVMIILLGASIFSWMCIFQRRQVYHQMEKQSAQFEEYFWGDPAFLALHDKLSLKRAKSTGVVHKRPKFKK